MSVETLGGDMLYACMSHYKHVPLAAQNLHCKTFKDLNFLGACLLIREANRESEKRYSLP